MSEHIAKQTAHTHLRFDVGSKYFDVMLSVHAFFGVSHIGSSLDVAMGLSILGVSDERVYKAMLIPKEVFRIEVHFAGVRIH